MRILTAFCLMLIIAGCANRRISPTDPDALTVGTPFTIYSVTTREQEPDGDFGSGRSNRLHPLKLTVSIPPEHTPGELKFGYKNADPNKRFVMAGREELQDMDTFRRTIQNALAKLPYDEREVTVFVHGFNSTQAEAAFRMSQFANDMNITGPIVLYSWPSRGRPLGYVYDSDSMLFARDGLEQVLREVAKVSNGRMVLMAHSLGSSLSMETLRQIDIANPGWSARSLNGVALFAPDIDIAVFQKQAARLKPMPQPFVVFVSEKDTALNISSRLSGAQERQRLGNIRSIDEVANLPISIVDTTAFSKDAATGHFVAASSPAMIALFNETKSGTGALTSEKRQLVGLLDADANLSSAVEVTLRPTAEVGR